MRRETSPDDLLAAYVDGVGELTSDERRRVEALLADDPAARETVAPTRALLEQLRDLPAPGAEPDWTVLERSIARTIHIAVGPDVPRPWWKRWRWAISTAALATSAAVIALVVIRHPPIESQPLITHEPSTPEVREDSERVALYLDGHDLEVEIAAGEAALDDFDFADPPVVDNGYLTPADLADSEAMVDDLDDASLDRLENWLDRSKG